MSQQHIPRSRRWSRSTSAPRLLAAVALAWSFPTEGSQLASRTAAATADDARWDDRFNPVGVEGGLGSVHALAWDGSGLYVGGYFATAGKILANNVARWDLATTTWSALGSGLEQTVPSQFASAHALAWDGSSLYVGGRFTLAGGFPIESIARWNPSTQTWSPLGGGVDGGVTVLLWEGSALYVGGGFGTAGGVPASKIARWDAAAGAWSALGSGFGAASRVETLAWDGAGLYAAGWFGSAGGVAADNIARWDPASGAWDALGSGVGGSVNTLAWDGNALYVGGAFDTAGGAAAAHAARWDPRSSTWSPLGAGVDGQIRAMAWDGAGLYVGGGFSTAGGAAARNSARWDPAMGWTDLGAGTDGWIEAIAWSGTELVAAGRFDVVADYSVSNIARWDPMARAWSVMNEGAGTSGSGLALAWDGSGLYACCDVAGPGELGRFDPLAGVWSALGPGIDGWASVLAWDGSGLYAAGSFATAGGAPASNVARWDPSRGRWSALGAGVNDVVRDLAWDGSGVYVGGQFSRAGGAPALHISRWDAVTGTWSVLGTGTDHWVEALAWDGSALFVGGWFDTASGVTTSKIARWEPVGETWMPVGSGVDGGLVTRVLALSWNGSRLFAGGEFTMAGGQAASRVAQWDPSSSSWSSLGAGVDDEVTALLGDVSGDVVVVGWLTTAGSRPVNGIARWDATSGDWSALGSGFTGYPAGSLVQDGSGTYVGGGFFTAGGKPSSGIARYSDRVPADIVVARGAGPPNDSTVSLLMSYGSPTPTSFFAYGAGGFGTNVAWGDVAGDGDSGQILTGPGPGSVYGPHLRAFRQDGAPLAKVSFYAYGTPRYGVNVGSGLLDADPTHEMMSGAGPGAVFGPHVRGFDFDGSALRPIATVNFFAYATLRYGAKVHGGDVDADGWEELLTGPGPGVVFGAVVRGFDYDGGGLRPVSKLAFDAYPAARYGVNVAGGDVEGDGFAEIVTAPGPSPAIVSTFLGFDYDAASIAAISGFMATPFATAYGGRLGAADITGDGSADLIAAPGPDPVAVAELVGHAFVGGTLAQVMRHSPFSSAYGANVAGGPLGY